MGSATSPESAADLVVGRPGTPGTPTALSGQTGFVVSFSPGKNSTGSAGLVQQTQQNARESARKHRKCCLPGHRGLFATSVPTVVNLSSPAGSPSAATAFYYTIYPVGSETPATGGENLLADPATATGATVPSTPSGSTDYRGLTPFDRLQFNTGNLALKSGLTLAAGVYQVSLPGSRQS